MSEPDGIGEALVALGSAAQVVADLMRAAIEAQSPGALREAVTAALQEAREVAAAAAALEAFVPPEGRQPTH